MRTIEFSYSKGWNDVIEEVFYFDDDTTDKEIQDEFEIWVWELIGDNCGWQEV